MIRVLILSPFTYIYGSKEHYLNTGESVYLDLNKEEEKQELKTLLSPSSLYKQWVHIDQETLPQWLKDELEVEGKGTPLPETNANAVLNQPALPKTDFTALAQEPKESIFLKPEITSTLEKPKEEQSEQSEQAEQAEEVKTEKAEVEAFIKEEEKEEEVKPTPRVKKPRSTSN